MVQLGEQFKAFRVHKNEHGFRSGVERISLSDLPDGDVTVEVRYSGVNYKDGLASTPEGKIVRKYPFIPGIDLAGQVIESSDARFNKGDLVLCTGYGLGVSHEGGYAEIARVPSEWLVPLPDGLTLKEAMAIGTAGFTAALSVERLLANGLTPQQGPVLVGGATGGVGSMAVSILSRLGYEVIAVTGKTDVSEKLTALGAQKVITREEAAGETKGVLGKELWAAVVDPVGGSFTSQVVKSVRYGGSVALSGLTAGGGVETSVYPYILRGVNLLGIDSVFCPNDLRLKLWQRLSGEWKPESALSQMIRVYDLEQLPELLGQILEGKAVGRSVISLK
ncbi:putative YhdH/YhfP family quinone oxidoreductase [Fontibacillus solani]|uniref:Putative YhdH/YhfP family quinone oxidoreductase n=1 Tax=Fontibacillus solani TaxID=1572857 RepID=A0A7W3SV96_9BACL|nr:putative YhdH/YhfP family quinone oxidoreductase [Fontibacillus solani]